MMEECKEDVDMLNQILAGIRENEGFNDEE
jgi:hypothetical protein